VVVQTSRAGSTRLTRRTPGHPAAIPSKGQPGGLSNVVWSTEPPAPALATLSLQLACLPVRTRLSLQVRSASSRRCSSTLVREPRPAPRLQIPMKGQEWPITAAGPR